MGRELEKIAAIVQHYDHEKYWKMYDKIRFTKGKKIQRIWWLFRIKRMDAFNGASLGIHLEKFPQFDEAPSFPHGIRGVFVTHKAKIGKNCCIYHQVTIGGATLL